MHNDKCDDELDKIRDKIRLLQERETALIAQRQIQPGITSRPGWPIRRMVSTGMH